MCRCRPPFICLALAGPTMCETGSKQQYRERLIKLIHDNVSVCKEKFGGRTLLATESEVCVSKAIGGLELILQDGLKPKVPVTLKNMNLNVNNFTLRYTSIYSLYFVFKPHFLSSLSILDKYQKLLQMELVWSWVQDLKVTSQVTHNYFPF